MPDEFPPLTVTTNASYPTSREKEYGNQAKFTEGPLLTTNINYSKRLAIQEPFLEGKTICEQHCSLNCNLGVFKTSK